MVEAQKAKIRIVLCGTIPDPRPAVDSKLKLLDAALKDLEMGQGNNYLSMRATMLDARGQVRKDLYKTGDIHLNSSGTKIASLRIRNMLEIMLPNLVQAQVQAPVPAPVVANAPPAVNVPLVAAVVQAPAGVQQLVGQLQDLVVQQVAIVQPPVAMEVEGDNEILKRLFLQRFGRALPEPERNEVDDMVNNMDLIDLTKDEDEMEVATSEVVQAVVVVKTEAPEAPEAPIDDRRRSSRLERRGLRKNDVIPEKEAPLAASTENVVADNDTDMAEDTSVESVNNTESGNTVEPLTAAEAFEMAEQAIAESDAAIAANQMVIDKFYDV
jgi:hypothetical protein